MFKIFLKKYQSCVKIKVTGLMWTLLKVKDFKGHSIEYWCLNLLFGIHDGHTLILPQNIDLFAPIRTWFCRQKSCRSRGVKWCSHVTAWSGFSSELHSQNTPCGSAAASFVCTCRAHQCTGKSLRPALPHLSKSIFSCFSPGSLKQEVIVVFSN